MALKPRTMPTRELSAADVLHREFEESDASLRERVRARCDTVPADPMAELAASHDGALRTAWSWCDTVVDAAEVGPPCPKSSAVAPEDPSSVAFPGHAPGCVVYAVADLGGARHLSWQCAPGCPTLVQR